MKNKGIALIIVALLLMPALINAKTINCNQYNELSEVNACETCQDKYGYEKEDRKLLDTCVEKITSLGHHPGRSGHSKVLNNTDISIAKCKEGMLVYYQFNREIIVNTPYTEAPLNILDLSSKYC